MNELKISWLIQICVLKVDWKSDKVKQWEYLSKVFPSILSLIMQISSLKCKKAIKIEQLEQLWWIQLLLAHILSLRSSSSRSNCWLIEKVRSSRSLIWSIWLALKKQDRREPLAIGWRRAALLTNHWRYLDNAFLLSPRNHKVKKKERLFLTENLHWHAYFRML